MYLILVHQSHLTKRFLFLILNKKIEAKYLYYLYFNPKVDRLLPTGQKPMATFFLALGLDHIFRQIV